MTYFISGPICMLETWIHFCFHGLLGQESQWNVSQIRDLDAWPCMSRSRDLTIDLFYLGTYTVLETWIYFCFHGLLGQESQWHVSQIRDLDAWPCTSRSHDLSSDLFLSRDLYMLDTWIYFCFHGLLGHESQWHVNQIRDLDAWPWTSKSHDLSSDLFLSRGPIHARDKNFFSMVSWGQESQ